MAVLDSVRTLFAEMVDYAGLFPPASLDMRAAALNYRQYVHGEFAWMLGRLIIPASRLSEFEEISRDLLPRGADETWRISALLPPPDQDAFHQGLDEMARFNETHDAERAGFAVVDTVELRADSPRLIDEALDAVPDEIDLFVETPLAPDPRGLIAALAGSGARAKVRTGGVEPDMIPRTDDLVRFISACAASDVGFKATAGLHHPIRAVHPLTYEDNSPTATMHGFINVLTAASALRTGLFDEAAAADMLEEIETAMFRFGDRGVTWRDVTLDNERLALGRERFALSFGSCSFEEPVEDLQELGLI